MEIAIFKSVTTEDVLTELEAEGKKYDGLYVDMDNAPERKYVKDKAAEVKELIKKVDAYRIADKKAYGVKVEKEAGQIIERLKAANEPFTLLIDAYTLERKKILDDEKARKQAILDAAEFENDHEMGLLINKTYAFDKSEELRIQTERDDQIRKQATIDAEDRQRINHEERTKKLVDEEKVRLANKEHCAKVNRTILACLLDEGFDENEAKKFIKLAAQNKLPQLTINY